MSQTEGAKKFYESEEYSKIKEARGNFAEFKEKLKEGVENT